MRTSANPACRSSSSAPRADLNNSSGAQALSRWRVDRNVSKFEPPTGHDNLSEYVDPSCRCLEGALVQATVLEGHARPDSSSP